MAIRSQVEIDIDTSQWQKYEKSFADYKDSLNQTTNIWKSIGSSQPRISNAIAEQAKAWHSMALDSKTFAGNITEATKSLLRWSKISGLISGVLGIGGLYGIDRLAASAADQRKSAMGLGVTAGEQRAFGITYGQVVNSPGALLSGVNEALSDPTKQRGLFGLGLNPLEEQNKGTAQASQDVLMAAKRLFDQTPESQLGTLFLNDQRGLSQFGLTFEDAQRMRKMSTAELANDRDIYKRESTELNVPDQTLKLWQDLNRVFQESGQKVENAFMTMLTPLAKPIGDLSTAIADVLTAFGRSPDLKNWMEQLGSGLETFAHFIGTPAFKADVETFVHDVGVLANAIAGAVAKIAGWLEGSGGGAAGGLLPDHNSPEWQAEEARRLKKQDEWDKAHQNEHWWNWFGFGTGNDRPLDDAVKPAFPGLHPSDTDLSIHPVAYRAGFGGGGGFGGITLSGPVAFMITGQASFATAGGGLQEAAFRVPMPSGAMRDKIAEAQQFFGAVGYTPEQTGGILDNLVSESALNPGALNSTGHAGIAQWDQKRQADFARLFGHSVLQGTYEEQLAFVASELKTTEKATGDRLRAAMSRSEATAIVNEGYERSGVSSSGRVGAAGNYGSKPPGVNLKVDVNNATGGNSTVAVHQLSV